MNDVRYLEKTIPYCVNTVWDSFFHAKRAAIATLSHRITLLMAYMF